MGRVEVPVRTSLRFIDSPVTPILTGGVEAESVVIDFEGRELGWVMPRSHDEHEAGPTVTAHLDSEAAWRDDAWNEVLETIQRFLSALAFHFDTRMESRPTSGGSGEPELLHPYGAIEIRDTFGTMLVAAPRSVAVLDDPKLRLALAVYREGLNAGSPFYRFLAFWNVIDAVHGPDDADVDLFLGLEGGASYWRPDSFSGNAAAHLRQESRNAIAHVVRPAGRTVIDPDLPQDRERLDAEGRWIQYLAHRAIKSAWTQPVVMTARGPIAGQ